MQILFVFVVTVIALLWHHKSKGYLELVEELGCHNTEFRLSCASLNSNIAIFEASFYQNDSFLEPLNTPCGSPGHTPDSSPTGWNVPRARDWKSALHRRNSDWPEEINFRHAVNKRCSGVNYCSFVLSEDFEEGSRLGPGAVYLRYACAEEEDITRACNSKIEVSEEGFVQTPGYPEYYIGETSCLWTLRAPEPQKVKITFLDVSLRGIGPFEGSCLDWLTVSEDGLNLLNTCGDVLEEALVLSDGSVLNVTFRTSSKTLFPKRGFLFHYKAVGCPALRKPQDGYLVNRNDTFAHFRCCPGFIFSSTMTREKVLRCRNENTWDSQIEDCVNVTYVTERQKKEESPKGNLTAQARAMTNPDSLKDLIIPVIIICILFIGNAIILYFIHIRKKRLTKKNEETSNEMMEFTEEDPESQ